MCSRSVDAVPLFTLTIAGMQAMRSYMGHTIHPHQSLALLSLGKQQSTLLVSEGDTGHPEPVLHHMQVGLDLLVRRTFKKRMPTGVQLEQAIMLIEDAVTPLARLLPQHSCLLTTDPLLADIAKAATGQTSYRHQGEVLAMLHREQLEQLFQTVAQSATSAGHIAPPWQASPHWVAALVVLRETLHHWQAEHIHLLPASAMPAVPVLALR